MTSVFNARNAGAFIAAIFFSHSPLQSSFVGQRREMEEKVRKYEEFLNDRLRKDLETVRKTQEEVNSKIAEYLHLKNIVKSVKDWDAGEEKELKTQVDLGCNFYCQARITDPSKIFVLVGYGFYVQFTLDEALSFIEKKCNQLTVYSAKLGKDCARIKAHIKLVLEGLRELQEIRLPEEESRPIW